MNEPPTASTFLPPRFFRPWYFLAGLALGLAILGWLGRRAARTDYHPDFTRFFPTISPEGSYFPTVDEMCAIVRARCRPDQVLVIVGGNSVLQGVAQPAPVMWSKTLQDLLGDHYCVVNFALRGATPADGGGVIAEVLRDEFPRQIYIANEKALTGMFPLGNAVYRQIFWQAYLGGRLLKFQPRDARVWEYFRHPDHFAVTPEIFGRAMLDRALRFEDFWNRMAFEHLNTVPSLFAPAPPALFTPRKFFHDDEPDGASWPIEKRYIPAVRDLELKIIRGTSELAYDREGNGWRLKAGTRKELEFRFAEAFPTALRPRTLLLIGRDSSYYRRQLPADELARDEQAIEETLKLLKGFGYNTADYGKDFSEFDYFDRTHLTASGGDKLAAQVAAEVVRLSTQLGYLK